MSSRKNWPSEIVLVAEPRLSRAGLGSWVGVSMGEDVKVSEGGVRGRSREDGGEEAHNGHVCGCISSDAIITSMVMRPAAVFPARSLAIRTGPVDAVPQPLREDACRPALMGSPRPQMRPLRRGPTSHHS